MSGELVVSKIDALVATGLSASSLAGAFERTLAIANVVEQLQNALTPAVMKPIMSLQGKKLGFKTDVIYPENIVKDCCIEAMLAGVQVVGNQFNIIASNCYITKEGFTYLLNGLRDKGILKDYMVTPQIPKISSENGAIAKVIINWTTGNEPKEKEMDFAVKVNKGMGADAINGKAERKAKCWLYNFITNSTLTDADIDDVIEVKATKTATKPLFKEVIETEVEAVKEKLLTEMIVETPITIEQLEQYLLSSGELLEGQKLSKSPELVEAIKNSFSNYVTKTLNFINQ